VIWSNQREPFKPPWAREKGGRTERRGRTGWWAEEKVVPQHHQKYFRRDQNMTSRFDVYDAAPDPANPRARAHRREHSLFNEKGAKAFEAGPLRPRNWAGHAAERVPVQLQVR